MSTFESEPITAPYLEGADRLAAGDGAVMPPRSRGKAHAPEWISSQIRTLPIDMLPQAAGGTWECVLRQLPGSGDVLCAAAGRGGMSKLLHEAGYGVTSVDLHPEHFLAEGLTCYGADLNQAMPFADDSFDVVLAVELAEHLESPWAFLREALRVLRPSGRIIFTSPNVTSLPSRWTFLRSGLLPYFREESFVGCYHVTPIFPWAVERWARTAGARIESITHSRVDWPDQHDLPDCRTAGIRRRIKDLLPLNRLTGETNCFVVTKGGSVTVEVGAHTR